MQGQQAPTSVIENLTKEVMRDLWAQHIDFLMRNLEVAKIAKEPVFIHEMEENLKTATGWYVGLFGEKELKKKLRKIAYQV